MEQIRTLFWDVGGVLLTNAWDHEERRCAFEHFHIDAADFEPRHKAGVTDFEQGEISLDDYLAHTVFYTRRDFTNEEFKSFMFSLSKPKSDVLEFARALTRKYRMATINNESRELNEYRIQHFVLTDIFDFFVSSCYVRLRKPDERIYRLALDLVQKNPEECCFIDDRLANIEGAASVGLHTVQMQNADQLKSDLQRLGITP